MNENSSLEIEINATDPQGDFILFSKTAGDDRHSVRSECNDG